jgi:cytochrome P450
MAMNSEIKINEMSIPIEQGAITEFPRDPIGTMKRLHQRHGKLAMLSDQEASLVFGFGGEYNQRVLSDTQTFHSQFFAVRGPRHSAQRRLTCGILSMNGDEHRRHRRMVHGPFQKRAVSGYRKQIVELVEEQLLHWQTGQIRDIHRDSVELLLRITSCVLFGFDHRELSLKIGVATERWVQLNHENGMGSLVSAARNHELYEQLLQQAQLLEGLLLEMIALRRASADPSATDVLNLLIHAHDEQGVALNDEELIGQAAILFSAAHLTTANSLSWTLFLLAQHPDVGNDLYDELWSKLHGDAPELAQLDQFRLLNRVTKESMRCLPASAYSQRISTGASAFGSTEFRRGTMFIFSQFMTHHLEELYTQPYRFQPQRWDTLNVTPYEYLPFAAGPRMCIGATLAMQILHLAVSVIWQRHRLTVVPGAAIDGVVTSTMLGPRRGIPMLIGGKNTRLENHWVRGNIHDLLRLDWPVSPKYVLPKAA